MATPERHLPSPQTVNDFYAAALLDRLDTLHDLLNDRLPAHPVGGPVAPADDPPAEPEPVAVKEPAPARRPYKTRTGKAGR